ncbi:MAG: S41 family peptidase [Rikenellaceae bacterium]
MNHSSQRRTLIFSILLFLAAFGGVIGGRIIEQRSYGHKLQQISALLGSPQDKVSSTLSFIDKYYIDSVSRDSIIEALMPHIFDQLDPHSIYIPAEEMPEMNESLEGEFDGIGVVFNMATDTVIVINVIPSGPSDKAGMRGGDRIVMINDSLVAGVKFPQNDVMKLLRGKRGTTVKLGVERQGASELLEVEVTRDVIPIKSIQSSIILRDSIGYIKMLQFARTTHSEIVEAIDKLEQQGMRSLILDLRGNSGGYLDQAISIANELLPSDNLIVYTEDRDGRQQREYSDGKGRITDLDIVILIDEGSASSSEILAGALQDNDRGTIIGRRSFGKGLVQQQVPFGDGSAMRLTIARYYTPTGRSIQKSYTNGDNDSYQEDMINRYAMGELFVADSIHFVDSLKKVTPKGKVVYGGGGIMPDIFVPADTTDVTRYYIEVSARNILYNFTTKYADAHRDAINSVTSFEELDSLFASDTELFNNFITYASQKGVKPVWSQINRSRKILEAQLKAYIGRNTPLDDDAFYHNIYPIDVTVLKAIETLENQTIEELREGQITQKEE